MITCKGCIAQLPRLRFDGSKLIVDDRGRIHAMGEKGKFYDLISCTRNGHEHSYEQVQFCSARVCTDCGEHAGKQSCGSCGWTGSPEELPEYMIREVKEPQEQWYWAWEDDV